MKNSPLVDAVCRQGCLGDSDLELLLQRSLSEAEVDQDGPVEVMVKLKVEDLTV